MRAVSSSQTGRGRTLVFAVLAGLVAGWLLLTAPAQVERFTAGHTPDAGMQTADPGWGGGGGGGG